LLPDPKHFKLFAGLVLFFIGFRLLKEILKERNKPAEYGIKVDPSHDAPFVVTQTRYSFSRIEFDFAGESFSFPPLWVSLFCFLVGIAGGIYGIGGGSLVAPFLVALFKIPVYTVAGATLMGTLLTSIAGVSFYHLLGSSYPDVPGCALSKVRAVRHHQSHLVCNPSVYCRAICFGFIFLITETGLGTRACAHTRGRNPKNRMRPPICS
jgi:uncharacterized membrane protein YfcA